MRPKEIFKKIRRKKRNILTVEEARKILEFYKIPFIKSELVKNEEDAVLVAQKIGFPIVLKVVSPQVIHKTDVGALVTNIENEKELRRGFRKIIINVKRKIRQARIDGILVQKMIENGQEVIVGGKKDPQFGQVIMFGLGGIFVEVFEDVSFRIVPISRFDAVQMIQEIKGYRVLKGFRGKKYDVKTLIGILLKVSKLLEDNQEILELDINPLIVSSKGAVAVDARIVID